MLINGVNSKLYTEQWVLEIFKEIDPWQFKIGSFFRGLEPSVQAHNGLEPVPAYFNKDCLCLHTVVLRT